jgi:hypothetical protein
MFPFNMVDLPIVFFVNVYQRLRINIDVPCEKVTWIPLVG